MNQEIYSGVDTTRLKQLITQHMYADSAKNVELYGSVNMWILKYKAEKALRNSYHNCVNKSKKKKKK